ncbi:hypothetical protein KGQ34_02775 [Patescibacteria group bacterium]|nr:hypothetical protein [Patescibacteria group bacterium]
MAIERARKMSYSAPHEIRQDMVIFKEHAVIMSANTLADMAALLPKLVAAQFKTRQVAKRRQASARAARATKKGPKVKAPRDERKKGNRDR